MWRYAIPVVVLAVLGVFFARGLHLNPGYVPSPLIGKPAPEFELPSLQDPTRSVGSADWKGQVALLNVWATWCIECRHEHQYLLELAATSGVPIYGLNWKDDRAAALKWLDTLGNPYAGTAFDLEGHVAIDWGVYGAPETFLIGRDGTVLQKRISVMTPAVWNEEFLPKILEECGSLPCPPVSHTRK
jgi:cytochrome c biogenesis protein CcmG, thiol:disulfide interchange protein DsbE